ncbi:LOW QUALITY PROTEIN: RNA polymerase II-associated protein 1 [Tachyglossus aculeatus]|uniref:LOW QUALITY PROTEIN: RNA polymerase II-associated protein 1 n=1 Tax=Tachyglossus aculeatus TaxID=9261 RepID=UPI0018F6167C|nr:LOW QUALITY PROTEIN: RNA polymerase II-associated protein 1 [Tachyglossus aculeatus]
MLSRPKPGESEGDLLRFQSQFLAAGASSSAVRLVKKAGGGAGDPAEGRPLLQAHRDVVTLDALPDLTPAPPKRPRPGPGCPPPGERDAEERLDRHDRHVAAVLSKIIERDTSAMAVTLPLPTGTAFPQVFHCSQWDSQGKMAPTGKRSIFAQEIAARRAEEAGDRSPVSDQGSQEGGSRDTPRGTGTQQDPLITTGEDPVIPESQREAQTIDAENEARLEAMDPEEILREQQQLLSQLDPSLVAFLRSRGGNASETAPRSGGQPRSEASIPGPGPGGEPEPAATEESVEPEPKPAPALPVTPRREWLHMDTVELDKLQWTQDLPRLRQKRTREGMQARFSLQGELLAPDADLPTHLGLHHHGEEAERAGYSLQELFHLSRSQASQQRTLALQVLARVVHKAQAGEFSGRLSGSVLRLLLDAGFLFLLRFSLDDGVDGVIAAAVRALRALLVAPGDEELLDATFSWYQGAAAFPLIPSRDEEEDEEDEEEEGGPPAEAAGRRRLREENRPPADVARRDVIKGLLSTRLLARLRYVLEVTRPAPAVVLDVLAVLTRLARHSLEAATKILECPRLMETLVRDFLPSSWAPVEPGPGPVRLHGLPCAAAMKLLRVLASAGRNLAARLLGGFDLWSRLSRFVAEAPAELALPLQEAEQLSTEAFCLWAVVAAYGQGGDLYRELYPVLVRTVQALARELRRRPPHGPAVRRAGAIVTLLTQLTQAAGISAEPQAAPGRDATGFGHPSTTPPLTWAQVSGLRTLVEPCLRLALQELPRPETWPALAPLPTACLVFLGTHFRVWSQQPQLCPVDYLQEAERLLEELLLPLLNQPALQSQWDALRACSPLCNPLSCAPAPEATPGLVSLGCAGGRPPLSLAGSASPFPFLTALLFLLDTLAHVHKGLCDRLAAALAPRGLHRYLRESTASSLTPRPTPSSAWALRHEYHLQHLVLSLAQRVAGLRPDPEAAALHHGVALSLLSRLLPGSEHLVQELLLGSIFRPDFFPERAAGATEAAEFWDRLQLEDDGNPGAGRGALLATACDDLPAIRACYLAHCAPPRPALLTSQARYRGEPLRTSGLLLPAPREPLLPADWSFLPLVDLYHRASGPTPEALPPDALGTSTRALQWLLVLESWRPEALRAVPPAARLARLMCLFLTGSELFREAPVQRHTWALLRRLCRPRALPALRLDRPLPGLASFPDLFASLLEQFEAVSFGDALFGALILLPLQRRFSVTLRLALFGEHVGVLRALGLPLAQLPVPLECYTAPPEDSLPLLRLYFRVLVTGTLRPGWCPVLYAVAVAHVNSFIFSQETAGPEVTAARRDMLRKIWLLADRGLRRHLLFYKLPSVASPYGFELYPQLPALRQRYLQSQVDGLPEDGHRRPGPPVDR